MATISAHQTDSEVRVGIGTYHTVKATTDLMGLQHKAGGKLG